MTTLAQSSVAIIGGGLAGLAAAVRLRERGLQVELFEGRRTLGGRAASYRDAATGELIDHCQHVSMACCTNFQDFCDRTGIAEQFDRYRKLHFFGPDGQRYDLQGSRWLPAPLHLAISFLRQGYLPWRDRWRIGGVLLKLSRVRDIDTANSPTIGQWLRMQGVSELAINRFWSVVLVSALGETVDRASLPAARKVFVDGFMVNRTGYAVDVPRLSLRELFDEQVPLALEKQGTVIHRQSSVSQLSFDGERVGALQLADGLSRRFDRYLLAVPWHRVSALLAPELAAALPNLAPLRELAASPISGVHLWFDRALTTLPHAVLVDRLTQWVFRRPPAKFENPAAPGHYYQVVISASRDLSQLCGEEVLTTVLDDLKAIFPAAREAKLLASKIVTEREAVFSYRPGFDQWRPGQKTAINNLFLAGDWTRTGWPATMESAVRSGYLAASGIMTSLGQSPLPLAPDLPRDWLAKICVGNVARDAV